MTAIFCPLFSVCKCVGSPLITTLLTASFTCLTWAGCVFLFPLWKLFSHFIIILLWTESMYLTFLKTTLWHWSQFCTFTESRTYSYQKQFFVRLIAAFHLSWNVQIVSLVTILSFIPLYWQITIVVQDVRFCFSPKTTAIYQLLWIHATRM